jgi:hypothetical protein
MTDRSKILVPCRNVVTKPVAYVGSRSDESRASDYHWALFGLSLEHAVSACFAHHRTVSISTCQFLRMPAVYNNSQVMRIVLGPTALMNQICIRSPVAQAS